MNDLKLVFRSLRGRCRANQLVGQIQAQSALLGSPENQLAALCVFFSACVFVHFTFTEADLM